MEKQTPGICHFLSMVSLYLHLSVSVSVSILPALLFLASPYPQKWEAFLFSRNFGIDHKNVSLGVTWLRYYSYLKEKCLKLKLVKENQLEVSIVLMATFSVSSFEQFHHLIRTSLVLSET